MMREWLVIESSRKNSVFAGPEAQVKGYIPRDIAELLLGRDLGGMQWFSAEESAKLRTHASWRDEPPEVAFHDLAKTDPALYNQFI